MPTSRTRRDHTRRRRGPEGVLVYMRTAEGTDALAWIDKQGRSVTQSQLTILNAAECPPSTPALPRHPQHHDLVARGVEHMVEEERSIGGQLGRPSGARFRTYARLKAFVDSVKDTLLEQQVEQQKLIRAIDEIYRHTLRQSATDTLNRQLKSGISDLALADLVIALREENRLCLIGEEEEKLEPQIICSLGMFKPS